jgi:CubicO group peptidase (beta-lactamase class C family)
MRSHNYFAQPRSISFFLSRITIVWLIFAAGAAVFAQTMPADEAVVSRLDSAIAAHVANGFTGSVLIAHKGQVIVDKNYGVSVKAGSHPIYWLASNSKPILALAIMKLKRSIRQKGDHPHKSIDAYLWIAASVRR